MKKVLIPTKLDAIAKETLERDGFKVVQDATSGLPALAAANPDAVAVIVRSEKVTDKIMDSLPNLKLVVRAGSGYDNVDTKYARRKGVDVMNTPGANANGVAELVIALILAHFRHVVPGDTTTRAGQWEKNKYMGRELAEKTVGVLGLGNIGQLVGKRLAGFDVRLLGYDPVIAADRAAELGFTMASVEKIFAESDIVTLHIPENAETQNMVNAKLLGLMKPGALLVNCARAGVVDEAALAKAVKERKLGYCTDVYPEDAPGEKSVAPFSSVMLPHLGASTYEANETAARRAAEQLIAYFERGITRFVVNKGVPEGLNGTYQELAYCLAVFARHFLGTDKAVRRIECSLYGNLRDYAKWFWPPIAAGIMGDYQNAPLHDPEDAEDYFKQMGISYETRPTDESKCYGNSMTIDLFEGGKSICQVSVRGTVTEGNAVISRIDDFDKLYLLPAGHTLLVAYQDRPGVLAKITGACADAGINIDDIHAPRDHAKKRALAALKTNKPVPAEVIAKIRQEVGAEVAVAVFLPPGMKV